MARGWESKSIEEQQAESMAARKPPGPSPTPDELARRRERETLRLARSNLTQQLETAHSPRHRKVLEDALAEIGIKLARLA